MQQLTVSMVAPAFPYFPVWIAQQRGFFAERDIECVVEIAGTTDKVTQSVKEGRSQIGMVTPEGVIVDAAQGGPLRLVAGNTNKPPLTLIGGKGITRIEDLRGKQVGTSSLSEGTAILVQKMLAAHGLRYPGDYEFALVGAHPQRWAALQEGTIQAGLQLIPYDDIAVDAGFPALGRARDYVHDYAFTAVAVDVGWARDHRDIVVDALAAMREAVAWTRDNVDEAAAGLEKPTRTEPSYGKQALLELFEHDVVPTDLRLDPSALRAVLDVVREAELVGGDVELNAADVVDDSFIAAASASH